MDDISTDPLRGLGSVNKEDNHPVKDTPHLDRKLLDKYQVGQLADGKGLNDQELPPKRQTSARPFLKDLSYLLDQWLTGDVSLHMLMLTNI